MQDVLAEVPYQVVEYMERNNIPPGVPDVQTALKLHQMQLWEKNPAIKNPYFVVKLRRWHFFTHKTKGQLISEWIFGVFKSPQKPTKFY